MNFESTHWVALPQDYSRIPSAGATLITLAELFHILVSVSLTGFVDVSNGRYYSVVLLIYHSQLGIPVMSFVASHALHWQPDPHHLYAAAF